MTLIENERVLTLPFEALYPYYLTMGGQEDENFKLIKQGIKVKLHISHVLRDYATDRFIINGKADEIYDRVTKKTYLSEELADEKEERQIIMLQFLLQEEAPLSKSYEVGK